MNKAERIKNANEIVMAISRHGRRFFYSSKHNRTARFELDQQGRLRFRDEWSDKPVLIVKSGRWRGFNNGGTLRSIVEDLARYIRTGNKIRNHFGPWPDWICGGDMWGYGDSMKSVRSEISDNPACK